MEKFINFENYFSITEQGNQFVITRKQPSKKQIYLMVGMVALYLIVLWDFLKNYNIPYIYFILVVLYPFIMLFQYFRNKKEEIIHKKEIKSIRMKNGIFNFNTRLIITLENGKKLRFYFNDETDTKKMKFFLESPIMSF